MSPRFGDDATGWAPGPGRTLDDVADTLDIPAGWDIATIDPHAGDLIDTSAESAPTAEDGPQPWEQT